MIPGLIQSITPSDSVPVEGVSTLIVLAAGDLALKGAQQGATALTPFAVTAGQQIYVPGRCFVMATGTTATVGGMG